MISLRGGEVSYSDTQESLVSFKGLGGERITPREVSRVDHRSLLANLLHSKASDVTYTAFPFQSAAGDADGGEETIVNTLATTVYPQSSEMLTDSVRGGNVTICIQFFLVNSTTNGNFFHTRFLIYMPAMPFVFQSPPIIQTPDIINMPIHSTACFSPPAPL